MKEEFTKIRYPSVRLFTTDTGRISRDKHYVRSLLEVDVTTALEKLKRLRTPGRKVSFMAWFIKLLANTVQKHPPINGIRKGRTAVWVPKTVNVSTVVEKTVDGNAVPLPLVLRQVNEKSYFQLNDEIQAAIDQPIEDAGNYVLGSGASRFLLELAALLPQWLRLLLMRAFILGSPQRVQEMMGTVMITSLGTTGRVSGWILPTSMHPLSLGLGSLNKKELIIKGQIQQRAILRLTVAFDHDIIDGMPAFKFVDDLVSAMESGAGLE